MYATKKYTRSLVLGSLFILIMMGIAPTGTEAFILPPKDYVFHCGGHVLYSNGVPAEGAIVELYIQEYGEQREYVDSKYVDENGYYSFSMSFDSRDPFVLMPHFILRVLYYWESGQEQHIYSLGKVTCDFDMGVDHELRIAAFFYNWDGSYLPEQYGEQLRNEEDFDLIYYFPEEQDWKARLRYIDTIETPNDHVFIYFFGHGAYHRPQSPFEIGYSKLWLDWDDQENIMTSYELGRELDIFDSDSLILFIESCYAGGFIDDCADQDRCVITTTDKYHVTICDVFTIEWFELIRFQNEYEAFLNAKEWVMDKYDGMMVPQCNHQLSSHWFEDW